MKIGDTWDSSWIVDEALYSGFIQVSNDQNPMHTDARFAQSKGFRDKVVHGNLLNAFLSYFIGEMLPIKNVVILGQSIKYAQPVYLNDKVYLKAHLVDHVEAVGMFNFDFTFEVAGNKVASGKIQIKEL